MFNNSLGKVVAKFCAKYLHRQVLKNEAYAAGDIGTSVQKAFFRLHLYLNSVSFYRFLSGGDEYKCIYSCYIVSDVSIALCI